MMSEDRYSNFNHERPNPPIRFYCLCGAAVNKDISENSCDEQHTGMSRS